MGRFIYNLLMPPVFLAFLPRLIIKYRSRGGWKDTYGERFARFGSREAELKKFHGAIWIHAVSVGETIVALSMIRRYLERFPERKFILSTTTTTGQDVARANIPENTTVIFCPLDFPWMVGKTLDLLRPSQLVIFETELWPNLIAMSAGRGIPVTLVNGRLSDHSARGYRKLRGFFAPLLKKFTLILAQSDADTERFLSVSPNAVVKTCGNMKFDQKIPELGNDDILNGYFGDGGEVILAGSTHPGEEELIVRCFKELKSEFPQLKLVLIPRHAERGKDVAEILKKADCSFVCRSLKTFPEEKVDVLLADTTGEMLMLMKDADIVIMGKSFAGHDEGHNLIEPALLSKPIVTGPVLRNFRYLLKVMSEQEAVLTAADGELTAVLRKLLLDKSHREAIGAKAYEVIGSNRGAVDRSIDALEEIRNQKVDA